MHQVIIEGAPGRVSTCGGRHAQPRRSWQPRLLSRHRDPIPAAVPFPLAAVPPGTTSGAPGGVASAALCTGSRSRSSTAGFPPPSGRVPGTTGWARPRSPAGPPFGGATVTGGAAFWDEHEHRWGVVLEFVFADERDRDAFRHLPVVGAALDAAPDPVNGVLVYPHRGGGSAAPQPRRPRPVARGGAAALPEPEPERFLECAGSYDIADAGSGA